jgi:hypothetical protein
MRLRHGSRASFVSLVWLVLLAACVLLGCPGGPGAEGPHRALPPYTGHAVELFDDAIEPQAVGLELEGARNPKGDPILRERTQVADAVVRVRITTVTGKQEDSGPTYQLGFRVVDQITGPHPPTTEFTIRLAPRVPAIGIIRNFEDRLVTMKLTFLMFLRGFARPDDPDGEMHFHLSRDSKEVLAAIMEAATLGEINSAGSPK